MASWLVRPKEARRRLFGLLMAPVLIQAAVYVLYWYPLAAGAVTGAEADGPDVAASAVGQVAVAALLTGWAPALFLFLSARQGRLLLVVQAVGPAGAVLAYLLHHLLP